jgi:drug/metabolite transporter (DMT)-like permease
MPGTALLLVLLSALLHAAWNTLLKRSQDKELASAGVFGTALIVTLTLTPFMPGRAFPTPEALLWGMLAGLGEGGYFVFLVKSLERAPLGWAYTWMRGGAVVLIWPVSMFFLGERLHWLAGIAVGIICVGLACMGLEGQGRPRALLWPLAASLFITLFHVGYKFSLAEGAHPVPLFALTMAIGLPIQLGERLRRRGWAGLHLPKDWVLVGTAGLVCTAGFLTYLFGLRQGGAGMVLSLRNVSVVFAVLFARFMGEKVPERQWAGALLVTLGAIGLSWPKS